MEKAIEYKEYFSEEADGTVGDLYLAGKDLELEERAGNEVFFYVPSRRIEI